MVTVERARQLVEQVRLSVDGIRERLVELHTGRAWLALGYAEWAEMCRREFDDAAVGRLLPRDQRRTLVVELAQAGVSVADTAAALGIGRATVSRDRAAARLDLPISSDNPPAVRPGVSKWSRRVEAISAQCPVPDLTDDEVRELLGAAVFLARYCQGVLTTREAPHHERTA